MLRIITNILKSIGFSNFVTAIDGVEAYASYSKEQFDIVITDWNMSNMNGLDLVKKIQSENKDIPIVMITTEGGKAEVITALKAGVNNYIVKPFTPQVLSEKLKVVLGEC